ncbi:glycosyltransferase family 2 protein [Agrococcus sp. SGAir0287]|uniref:glycosyltransferase family 2 protein n=1 Tax=Agrococcus sp. SGAir0287 TaxID=2070347 RepID=UPI001585E4F2|nr:glycosyltransferase family 2 protein [Agrococcus sp. SGAir0287]
MTRVSVALCTHQGERFLERQLRSILAQSHPVDEIVVGDDASTDGTIAIVERVAAETTVPILLERHDPPLGVAANFADAIGRTSGDVVALCDQDDVWHPDKVERMLRALECVDLAHSDARLVDEEGALLGTTLLDSLEATQEERARMADGRALDALLRRNLVTGATVLVRRSAAVAALPVPEGWIHDEWLAIVSALGGGVRLLPSPTIDYRQHGANQIGVRRLSLRQKVGRLLEDDSGAHARKALRATSLAREARARGLGTAAQRRILDEKAAHERRRAELPRARVLRVPGVVAGVVRGRYARLSRGLLDVARDLLERR